jgi:hypothetical protein
MPESEAPKEDHLEDLWRDYYRATFNPAGIKLKAMKREMPVRHWGIRFLKHISSPICWRKPHSEWNKW